MSKKSVFYIAITALFLILLGLVYYYFRQAGILDPSMTYKVKFENITGLSPGADVRLRGVKIGKVSNIMVDNEKPSFVIAELKVNSKHKIPKEAVLLMRAGGLMEGNFLAVEYGKQCSGANCAGEGFLFKTRKAGQIESMLGDDPMQSEFGVGKDDVKELMDVWKKKVISEDSDHIIGETLKNINVITARMEALEKEMEGKTDQYKNQYEGIMDNLDGLTKIMKDDKVSQITNDLKVISEKMENIDLKKPMDHANKTMAKAGELQKEVSVNMEDLKATMAKSKDILASFDDIKEKLNSSEGSVKYLMDENGLSKDLNETMGNVNRLNEDLNNKTYNYQPFLGRRKFLRKNPDKR